MICEAAVIGKARGPTALTGLTRGQCKDPLYPQGISEVLKLILPLPTGEIWVNIHDDLSSTQIPLKENVAATFINPLPFTGTAFGYK